MDSNNNYENTAQMNELLYAALKAVSDASINFGLNIADTLSLYKNNGGEAENKTDETENEETCVKWDDLYFSKTESVSGEEEEMTCSYEMSEFPENCLLKDCPHIRNKS